MKNPIMKTWRKVKSFGHTSSSTTPSLTKSKSCHDSFRLEDVKINEPKAKSKKESPAHGSFNIYVGPKKQRFVVKTKLLNHPLFKNLLEAAEIEYGYRRDGPIVLPCEVDKFLEVLENMKSNHGRHEYHDDYDDDIFVNSPLCGICSPYRSYGGVTDPHPIAMGRRSGSYKLLRSPSLFKLNRF